MRRDGAECHADVPPLAKKITRSAAMTYMAQTEALWKWLGGTYYGTNNQTDYRAPTTASTRTTGGAFRVSCPRRG